MKHFSCGAVVAGCQAVFNAPDERGILSQVAKHAEQDHGLTELSPELAEAVRLNITTVATAM